MKARWLIMLTGIVLLGACKGKNQHLGADTAFVPNQRQNLSKNNVVQLDEKLVKTADIRFKVKNVQQTGEQIASLTKNSGGMVVRHTIGSNIRVLKVIHLGNDSVLQLSLVNATSLMTVRLPPQRLEDFVEHITAMGVNIDSLNLNIQNRSLDYLSTRLKANNKENLITKQEVTRSAGPEKILEEKNDVVDRQLNNSRITDSVKTSTITLSFYETDIIKKEIIANDDLSAYEPPFVTRITLSLKSGWGLFIDLLVALANTWVLVLTITAAWFIYRYVKRSKPVVNAKA